MDGLFNRSERPVRWLYGSMALTVALALSGCGGVAAVGSTVASGAEAVGTLVKRSVSDEDGKKDEAEARPK